MDLLSTQNAAPSLGLTAEQQQAFDAAVDARTSRFEALVSQLTKQVNSLKASSKPNQSKSKSQPKPAKQPAVKQPTVKIKLRMAEPATQSANSNVTPKRSACAALTPPEVSKPKSSQKSKPRPQVAKPSSPKRHPQQMQGTDFPSEFTTTKNALFIHIKILWGLLGQDAVPTAPQLQHLQEFYNRFSNGPDVEQAALAASQPQ
ncbi:hypothetical protein H4Q26_012096 [Puccinia striiformis f. sp. tritici PST-130]|nr:hypothetical protein H4Q26_012096 [Puccinia striiformis f. sp. tritici PST-130]